MANEATKTKNRYNDILKLYLQGDGIDIGCGKDPIAATAVAFDQQDGDANEISKYIHKKFDYVFSCHSLEHMKDPHRAFKEWYELVKPGGHIITIVPDEDLYEQGLFPSRFNSDHKYTFTISKSQSWSPKSVNVLDLVKEVKGELKYLRLQEDQYDRSLYIHRPNRFNILMGKILGKLRSVFRTQSAQVFICKIMNKMGAIVDQTSLPDQRLAQIMFVVQKF